MWPRSRQLGVVLDSVRAVETPEAAVRTDGLLSPSTPALGERSWSWTQRWQQPLRGLSFEEEPVEIGQSAVIDMDLHRGRGNELYTGRYGTLSLSDFEYKFLAHMSDATYKSDKYNEQYELYQMPKYLGGEAMMVYRQFRDVVLERWREDMKRKPSGTKAKAEGSDGEERRTAVVIAEGSPARLMFAEFKREFPPKSVEKVEELMRFTFKPGESLKAAYFGWLS